MSGSEPHDLSDIQRTLITLELSLASTIQALESSDGRYTKLQTECTELHNRLFVGVNGQDPLVQQVAFLKREGEWMVRAIHDLRAQLDAKEEKAPKTTTPTPTDPKGTAARKIVFWTAIVTALGAVVTEWIRSGGSPSQ